MSDILDINSYSAEFEHDEEGDRSIKELKYKARKRKGRGLDTDFGGYGAKKKARQSSDCWDYSTTWDSSSSLNRFVDKKERIVYREIEDFIPQKSVEGWVLFVTGIHEEATEDDIFEKFSEIGFVNSVRINLDRRTGFLKGYALIEYLSHDDAYHARDLLDGAEFLGCKILVNWCFSKGPSKIMISQ